MAIKAGSLFIEVFSADDFSVEYREEINLSPNMLQMKLKSGVKGSDFVLIGVKDEEGITSLEIRVTKENRGYNPQGPRDDPKNYKFWNLAKFSLKMNNLKGLVKAQQLLKDDRLIRVSFIPD